MIERVAIFGLGYVGTVTAACLCRDGYQIVGVDIDKVKTGAMNRGESPVAEPGVEKHLQTAVKTNRLTTTESVVEAVGQTQMALVSVGTPSDDRGDIDSSAIVRVVRAIGEALCTSNRNYYVVIRSTLLPHLLEEEIKPALEESLGEPLGRRVHLCYNPEFLRESTAVADYDNPPFVLVGADEEDAAQQVLSLYARLQAQQIVTDLRTAALVKYACNAFHALKISFANEIGMLARSMNAEGAKVMDIVCQDRRLNISAAYLRPGFAFGGSCLPKDLRAINRYAERNAVPVGVLQSILPSNDSVLEQGVRLVQKRAGLKRRIGLIGLSFKAGTDDLRESPQVRLAETLIGRGYDVRIFDPEVTTSRLIGRNRSYVDHHLPHLAELLESEVEQVYQHAELLILGTAVSDHVAWQSDFTGEVVDLRHDLTATQPKCAPTFA